MTSVGDLEHSIGYCFTQRSLLKLALIHPSAGETNNQRLEYLGDAVLELCMSDLLYRLRPGYPEGRLTRLRASLVREATLLKVAEAIGLDKHMTSNPPIQTEKRGRSSILADGVEAVLAAVYLDGGFEAAMAFVRRHWAEMLKQEDVETSAKSALQEHYQGNYQKEVTYRTLDEQGPAHAREYLVGVYADGVELARGRGRSKKLAEQAAAKAALKQTVGEAGQDEA